MKKLFVLLYAGLASILTACETILPLDMPESEEWGITLNAVASPDTTFWAYVTHCYPTTEAPNYAYEDFVDTEGWLEKATFRDYYRSSIWGPNNWFNGKKAYEIRKESTLTEAEVELTVNGETTYPMVYDTLMLRYQSNYTPTIGDHLEVRINSASGEQTVARTEVPQPQKLEIVETETELLENGEFIENLSAVANRGYVKMKLRLHDPAGEKNYYRLAIRGIHERPWQDTYYVWDIYLSSDPIFRDERLTSEWGAWPAFFSDVFDDSLMNGAPYEFEIKTYVLGSEDGADPIYEVSLQSITEDYYRYLKSMQLYRISRSDTYSEGVYIHSNNEGGWGLLGGISGEVHRVEPFKDMNESSDGNGSPTN